MGLFGFGKKRTSAEILSDGRSQYVKGNLKKALSILRDLADEGNPQACCYVGRIYLEQKDKSLAQPYLLTAAKGGITDAATLLASQFGIRDYLPKEEKTALDVIAHALEKPAQESAPEEDSPDKDELIAFAKETEKKIEAAKEELEETEEKLNSPQKLLTTESESIPESIPETISEPAPEPEFAPAPESCLLYTSPSPRDTR